MMKSLLDALDGIILAWWAEVRNGIIPSFQDNVTQPIRIDP
jgi:hypothetical protein